MRKRIVGIMGPGEEAKPVDIERAHKLGGLIAQKGWATLTGGLPLGVMQAGLDGAKQAGGLTIAVLPHKDKSKACASADIVLATNMYSGRNVINVMSSDVIVACGIGPGTASEIALALKQGIPTVLLMESQSGNQFFKELEPTLVTVVSSVEEALTAIADVIEK